jgi:hypothetical protein
LKRDIQLAEFKASETLTTFDKWHAEARKQKEAAMVLLTEEFFLSLSKKKNKEAL